MLVLKRAISLILAFVLAYSPALAFARAGQANAPGFRAENRDIYDRQETAQEHKRSRKARAVKDTRAKSGKASKAQANRDDKIYRSVDEAINSLYRPIKYKGQEYVVSQVPGGIGKRAKAQMTRGKDFEEILVDENNTGTASLWQVSRGNVQVKASHPFHGSFSRIDVRERRAKAYINTHLQLNPDFKSYRIVGYDVERFKMQAYGSDVMGTTAYADGAEVKIECTRQITDATSLEGIKNLQDLLNKISTTSSTPASALQCRLQQYEQALIDKTCFDSPFGNSGGEIAQGLAKIFSSVGQHSASGKPMYLQCLNEHGFAYNSAQMQSHFINDTSMAKLALNNETNRPADAPPPAATSCNAITQVPVYKDGQPSGTTANLLDLSTPGILKPFTCSTATPDTADYNPATSQVIFQKNSSAVATEFGDAASGYAQLMFHELLHQSGLSENSEALVEDLEKCCGSPDPDSSKSTAGCANVQKYTREQKIRQDNENALGMYMPGYAEMRDVLEEKLGPAKADRYMGQWLAALKADPDASKAWDQLQACASAPGADAIACNKAAEPALNKFNSLFKYQTSPRDKSDYTSVKASIAESLNDGIGLQTQVAVDGTYKTMVNLDGYGTDAQTKAAVNSAKSIKGLLDPTSPAKALAATSKTARVKVASTGKKPSATVQSVAANSPVVDDVRYTDQSSTVVKGLTTTAPVAPTFDSDTDSNSAGSAQTATGDTDSTDSSSLQPSTDTSQAQATTQMTAPPTVSTSRSSNVAAIASTSSGATTKAMPTLSTAGAVPASTGAYAPGTENASGPLTGATEALMNVGAQVAKSAVNVVGQALSSSPAYAASVAAPARLPASAGAATFSNSSRPSGSSSATTSHSSDGDDQAQDKTAKPKSKTGDDEKATSDEGGQREMAGGQNDDPKTRAAIAEFASLKSARSDVVWKGLKKLGFETLTRELSHPEKSRVVQSLQANGWSVRGSGAKPFLVDPKGTCYLPDTRRTLVPYPSCGN